MLNEVFKDADGLSIPVPTGTLSGTALRLGVLNVVTITDEGSVTDPRNVVNGVQRPTGGVGNRPGWASGKTSGSFKLDVTGTVAKWGDIIYIKADNSLTTTAAGAFPFGAALETKSAPTKGKLHVRILQPGAVTASA